MAIKEILERADKRRERYDHIGWYAICRRCGLHYNIFADKCKKLFGNEEVDVSKKDIICESPVCRGHLKIICKMSAQRAIHLHDIMRRT